MRRAQSYVIDLALGMALLLVIGVPLGVFLTHTSQSPVQQEATRVAAGFLNPYPVNWTSSDVVVPGFAPRHAINKTLLDQTAALCGDDLERYSATTGRVAFNVTTSSAVLATCGAVPADADHVGAVRRYAAYNDTVATITVVVYS